MACTELKRASFFCEAGQVGRRASRRCHAGRRMACPRGTGLNPRQSSGTGRPITIESVDCLIPGRLASRDVTCRTGEARTPLLRTFPGLAMDIPRGRRWPCERQEHSAVDSASHCRTTRRSAIRLLEREPRIRCCMLGRRIHKLACFSSPRP